MTHAPSNYADIETATIGHFRSDCFMHPSLQAISPSSHISGPALTVRLPGDDGTALVYAVSQAQPGQVLVVDRCGDDRHACWGAVITAAAQARGIVGAVIDGYVTDRAAILSAGFRVWCRGFSPVTTKIRGVGGAVNVPVSCGGLVVMPGDIVIADENGVMSLSPELINPAINRAREMQAAEPAVIARLLAGERLTDITMPPPLPSEVGGLHIKQNTGEKR